MQRRSFLLGSLSSLLGASSVWGESASLPTLARTPKMPVMFVGHGSPMNAITPNTFHRTWQKIGKTLPQPSAILVISAHWRSHNGTVVMATPEPETIHDFGGFPDKLFAQQYPSPGSPQAAQLTFDLLKKNAALHAKVDYEQGLDHGTWSVLLPMFPKANIPVFQVSIDYDKPAAYHYRVGQQLAALRERGVLIIGSGNLVHNLWIEDQSNEKPYDWAQDFDAQATRALQSHNDKALIQLSQNPNLTPLAHPSLEHFWPLFYVLGAKNTQDNIQFFNQGYDGSAISMRSVIFSA
ncbi:4,5-DOPA dioxygenase extradiol [Thiofilum flexile]|uniref:4,5-DOPA-extradiol-dioxygenase n=1 Tax=Thiofilum flexile TaxID=125627 RepID=UPI00037179CA|nr:4,5-DOPA dioxygenase extradiol [Thiofilum flexile]